MIICRWDISTISTSQLRQKRKLSQLPLAGKGRREWRISLAVCQDIPGLEVWWCLSLTAGNFVTVVTACGAITFLIVWWSAAIKSPLCHRVLTRNGFTAADQGGGQRRTANLLVPMIRRKELVYTAQRYLQQHIQLSWCHLAGLHHHTTPSRRTAPPHNSFPHNGR